MSFFKEFFQFMRVRKKYWLFPVTFFMLLLGSLLFFSQGSSVAPFIYTLF